MGRRPRQDDPLALDRETMRQQGYRVVDLLVDRLARRRSPPLKRAAPEEMRASSPARRPRGRSRSTTLLDAARARRAAVHEPRRPPALLRVHPVLPAPGRARSATSSRAPATSTSARGWSRPARASSSSRCSTGSRSGSAIPPDAAGVLVSGGSAANMTALACAREALAGAMSRRPSSLYVVRPGALVGRAGGADARLPAGAGARAARRRRPSAAPATRSRRRSTPTCAPAGAPLFVARDRGRDEHRRGRPARRARASSAASDGVWLHVDAAYGGFAVLTERGTRALRGIELADSVDARPAQVALPAVRVRLRARARGRAAAAAFEIVARLPAGRRGRRRRGQLLRPRPAAHARARGRSRCGCRCRPSGWTRSAPRSTARSTSRRTRAKRVEESAELELLAPPSLGIVCFPPRLDERRRRGPVRPPRRRAAGGSSPRRGCTGGTRCACASSTTRHRGGCRAVL